MLEILSTVGIALSVFWGATAAIYLGPPALWRFRANREARAQAEIETQLGEMKSGLVEMRTTTKNERALL